MGFPGVTFCFILEELFLLFFFWQKGSKAHSVSRKCPSLILLILNHLHNVERSWCSRALTPWWWWHWYVFTGLSLSKKKRVGFVFRHHVGIMQNTYRWAFSPRLYSSLRSHRFPWLLPSSLYQTLLYRVLYLKCEGMGFWTATSEHVINCDAPQSVNIESDVKPLQTVNVKSGIFMHALWTARVLWLYSHTSSSFPRGVSRLSLVFSPFPYQTPEFSRKISRLPNSSLSRGNSHLSFWKAMHSSCSSIGMPGLKLPLPPRICSCEK